MERLIANIAGNYVSLKSAEETNKKFFEYENTGLTPAEITAMQEENARIKAEINKYQDYHSKAVIERLELKSECHKLEKALELACVTLTQYSNHNIQTFESYFIQQAEEAMKE